MNWLEHAYARRHGGGVLRQRVERGLHHFVVANVAVAFAAQIDDVGVGVEEGQDHAAGLVERVEGDRLAEVAQVPHLPLALRCAIEAGGEDARRLAQPRHLGALGAVVGLPLAHQAVLARIENAVHLVLCGHAEERAAVVPVQVLGKGLAVAAHHLVAILAIPHLRRSIATVKRKR